MESLTIEEAKGYWKRFMEFLKSVNPKPEEVRRSIYTTNVVKSVNAGLEFMRFELEGYFPSLKCFEVKLFIQFSNLNDK